MAETHKGVRQVDHSLFMGFIKELLGVQHVELVQRILGGHQEHQRIPSPPSGTPRLLPCGHDRAGVARDDGAVQAADVDAQFQCVRGDHATQFAQLEPRLDRFPLLRQVPGPVRCDLGHRLIALLGRFGTEALALAQHLLRHAACPGEHDRVHVLAQTELQQIDGLIGIGPSDVLPFCSVLRGGFQSTNRRRPLAEPSWSTTAQGLEVRLSTRSCGLAIVAEQQMNCGSAP